jgi:glycine hydroxymethyltransferase
VALDAAGITLNRNAIPDDPRSPFVTSGIRIGTPAVTTQGMTEPHMAEIGRLIATTLRNRADPDVALAIREEVRELCAPFAPYPT